MSKQNVKNHAPGTEERNVTPPMTKDLVNKMTGEVTEYREQPESEALKSDLIIPYLVIQQGLSDFVTQRKAQLGDICKSTDPTKMGDPDKGIEVVFLHCPKADYALEQKVGDKYKFRKTVPRNSANENIEWKYWSDDTGLPTLEPRSVGATEWRRVKRLSAFALVVGDMEAEKQERAKVAAGDLPDPSKALTPVMVSFRVMGYNAGKEIVTFYQQAKSMGVDIYRYRVPMNVKFEQNDKGPYYIWSPDRTKAKAVAKEDLGVVQMWADVVSSSRSSFKVDDGDQTEEAVPF